MLKLKNIPECDLSIISEVANISIILIPKISTIAFPFMVFNYESATYILKLLL